MKTRTALDVVRLDRHGVAAVVGLWLVGLLAGSDLAAQSMRHIEPSDIIATVGTRSITLAEIDEAALRQPAASFGAARLSQALYEARRAALDEMIGTILIDREAKTRGIDPAVLLDQEVGTKVVPVSDADVEAWYEENQARAQGATLDEVKEPIRSLLTRQRSMAARQAFVERLRAKTSVAITLEPPRQDVGAADGFARGPAGAPIQIVEFADFQCPFCQAVMPVLKRVFDTYGDRVRLVFRNYPLPNHPNARPAAEAAACAGEQGQFWPYHDRLFALAGNLTDADITKAVAELGLDTAKFDDCFNTHKYSARIEADIKDANEAGLTGTPAFFINGRIVVGSQPFAVFQTLIDDELARRK